MKEFAVQRQLAAINPTVRVNTNGFPYLTVIDKKGEAENIYFSKASGQQVSEGENILGRIKDISIAEVENAAGEVRTKLTFSKYVDLADLLGM